MNQVQNRLPRGVTPTLGPDATGVGWVFQYALVDKTGKHDLAQLRSLQDWYLRYQIGAVEGVAEVASLGGFVRQYQVNLDPNKLSAYRLPVKSVVDAIRMSNNDVGGRSIELSGAEYMVRGRGYIKSIKDIEMIAVGGERGTPILVRDIGEVALGPDMRRGIAELNGEGEVVSGVVVMRYGENALDLIERVKQKLKEIEPSLPAGVKIVTAYDRSDLILKSIATLKEKLLEEIRHCQRRHHHFSLPSAERPGGHYHAADRDPQLFYRHAFSQLDHQHHVVGRHCHRHRRHGRRCDHHGRECP